MLSGTRGSLGSFVLMISLKILSDIYTLVVQRKLAPEVNIQVMFFTQGNKSVPSLDAKGPWMSKLFK